MPCVSVAVQVTVVVPAGNVEPDAGLHVTGHMLPLGDPGFGFCSIPQPQLSLGVGVGYSTTAEH